MKIAIVGAGIAGVATAPATATTPPCSSRAVPSANRPALPPAACWRRQGWRPGQQRARRLCPRCGGRTPTLRNGSALTSADLAWLRRWRRAARACAREPTPQPPLLALERLARYSHERLKALAAGLKLDFERSAGAPLLLVRLR